MLPILLDLRDRLTVVVGAGVVGMRKVRAVRAAGGRVRVVCRESAPADWADPAVDWLTAEYATPHLHGAGLVFACGPAELNRRVAADARALGVLLCDADDPLAGDFSLPAIHRLGRLTLTVSTGGAAPGLAVWLRDQLAEQLDPKLADWLDGLAECRAVLAECADAAARRRAMARLTDPAWLARLHAEPAQRVRGEMLALARSTVAGTA